LEHIDHANRFHRQHLDQQHRRKHFQRIFLTGAIVFTAAPRSPLFVVNRETRSTTGWMGITTGGWQETEQLPRLQPKGIGTATSSARPCTTATTRSSHRHSQTAWSGPGRTRPSCGPAKGERQDTVGNCI
jgi:hypothetical protein